MNYKLSDFDYPLPKELIAQHPIDPRDHSRLLVLDKSTGKIGHEKFFNIVDHLRKGDVLVLNNSKVMPARLIGKKIPTDGKLEIFLLNKIKEHGAKAIGDKERWICLVGGRGARPGLKVGFDKKLTAMILKNNQDSTYEIEFDQSGRKLIDLIEKVGQVPLPPYIKRESSGPVKDDEKNYQTVYADNERLGSVAAPTAGLHFTNKLLKDIKSKGVQIEYVTLHVGLGTFAPVKTEDIKQHKMHSEAVEVSKITLENILKAKAQGRRIIAVGTTSVRTLESIIQKLNIARLQDCKIGAKGKDNINHKSQITNHKSRNTFFFQTDIFIYPGYEFKLVDGMVTNFHLPKSTLLMLVSALAGKGKIDRAYREAISKEYRFFSYGDAMLIV